MEEELIARPYQSQLEEVAMEKNTLIHLPTGSGKTFIAISLINRLREDLQKPWGQGGKRTFFLVNTVPLVIQQKKVIEKKCPVKGVGGYSGEDNVDIWDKTKWDEEMTNHQVVVMTSQILLDMLTHDYIRIENINLLIFDECHHAVDDHPMRLIMKKFEDCPISLQPRVLGLTATLLNRNVEQHKIQDALRLLETTFHATIATVNALGEVIKYSTNPKEYLEYYRESPETSAVQRALQVLQELICIIESVRLPQVTLTPEVRLKRGEIDISTDPLKVVKAVRAMVVCMISFIKEMGAYGGALSILAYIILLERIKRKSMCKKETTLFTFTITHSLQARMILLTSMKNDTGYDKIVKHSSNQIIKLLNILKEFNPVFAAGPGVLLKYNQKRNPLSGIIFTKQRFTAKILFNILKEVKKENPLEFGFLNHDFIVGFSVNPLKQTREEYYVKKKSQTALLKFANKELNCLIATSVIEEGVDIPQCLFVLKYDAPLEYRSYIQSKGRGRSVDATYIIMVNEKDRERFNKLYKSFLRTESCLQQILIGRTGDREAPSDVELQMMYDEDKIPPYITPNGNRLAAASAISLLNRYCSTLHHDQFTQITPLWVLKQQDNNNHTVSSIVTIIMPIACSVKEPIVGDPMGSVKAAKRSAALKTCIKLHQAEELDPLTLLPKHYGNVDFDLPDVKSCFPNWPWDVVEENGDLNLAKAGTKKRMRKHAKVFPSVLKGTLDWQTGEQTFYLHVVKLNIAFDKPKETREKALYDLLQRGEGYGFLTQQNLPKLCDFPMFLTVGEVTTTLEVNYAVIKLNVALFEIVKRFHFFLFDQVLDVAKKFLTFDGTENCMYVVPIIDSNGVDIDWSTMQTHTHVKAGVPPTIAERKSLHVTQEGYESAVVTPWYRGFILPEKYIVSRVLEYMTPQSNFDSDSYGTYEAYYADKYNLEIVGSKSQPMLEVRNISSRMNCLLPRAATIKTLSEKQQKLVSAAQGDDKMKGFNELFVPEFCIKYDFPGVYWYKAMVLPSVLHRVQMLLVAFELRAEISIETNYGDAVLKPGESWLPITVNDSIAKRALLSQVESPPMVSSIDRINDPIDQESKRPKVVSMKDSLYELLKTKINKDYPWDEKMEPIDIERNITTVTAMDIECYDEFASALIKQNAPQPSPVKSTPSASTSASSAILPAPIKYNDKISILTKQPTGRGPELRDVLAALTTINSHDSFDLERVETLGDSFLKFAATLYLFHKFPTVNEGQLTNIKGRLIGNRNLYYAGEKICLGGRMKIEQFSPRKDFLVPGFFAPTEIQNFIKKNKLRPTYLIGMQFSQTEALEGRLNKESLTAIAQKYVDLDESGEKEPIGSAQNAMQCYVKAQVVSDKSVADCVEALIGTYLLSGGILGAVKVLEWMQILPPQDKFASSLKKKVPTPITDQKATTIEIDFLLNTYRSDVEKIIDYNFQDASFLLEALSHPSYIRNRLTRSYERLEFLGDAILDFLITSHLFEHCRDLNPGDLTDLRSALVNNVTFAAYVVKLGLHKYILSQLNPLLDSAILTFVEHQEQRKHEILEDVLYLIDEEDCQIADYVEVPKVLSDVFESIVGAIFLDTGGCLETVWRVVYKIMYREIDNFSSRIPKQPCRTLYECHYACPKFGQVQVTDADVPRVMIPVTISKHGNQLTVHGFGGNKFQAKRAAAKLALRLLNIE